jgi:hypothetical protein
MTRIALPLLAYWLGAIAILLALNALRGWLDRRQRGV